MENHHVVWFGRNSRDNLFQTVRMPPPLTTRDLRSCPFAVAAFLKLTVLGGRLLLYNLKTLARPAGGSRPRAKSDRRMLAPRLTINQCNSVVGGTSDRAHVVAGFPRTLVTKSEEQALLQIAIGSLRTISIFCLIANEFLVHLYLSLTINLTTTVLMFHFAPS